MEDVLLLAKLVNSLMLMDYAIGVPLMKLQLMGNVFVEMVIWEQDQDVNYNVELAKIW